MVRRYLVAGIVFLLASAAQAAYSPATTSGWFIVVGRVTGFGGAQFRTDVWLFNPDAQNLAVVTLIFHPQVSSGGGAATPIPSVPPITLAPRETRYLEDVLLSTVAADNQVGALEWSSTIPVMGGMRSYTAPAGGGGTFGAFLPGIPETEAMTPKQSPTDSSNVLQMFGTSSGDGNYRTQLDVTNTSAVAVPIEVRVIAPNSVIFGGTQNFTIAPKSLLRVGRIMETVGAPLINGLRITVAIKEGTTVPSGGVLAVASTLDNRSQDQYAFVGVRQSGTVVPAEALPLEVLP